MTRRALILTGTLVALLGGCAPTIRVRIEPINIYAKLDANVRVRLDQQVQDLIDKNPNLF